MTVQTNFAKQYLKNLDCQMIALEAQGETISHLLGSLSQYAISMVTFGESVHHAQNYITK